MMLKSELQKKTQALKDATRTALQLLFDNINKLLKIIYTRI